MDSGKDGKGGNNGGGKSEEFFGKLLKAAQNYISARIALTKCRQNHFRTTCFNYKKPCRGYRHGICSIYSSYFHAWMSLQEAVKAASYGEYPYKEGVFEFLRKLPKPPDALVSEDDTL